MKNILIPVFSVLFALAQFSCTEDDAINVEGPYASGVFVVNEGNFGGGNGDITFYDFEEDSVGQNVFNAVNGYFPGDVLQFMQFEGEEAWLVLNGSNKVEVVDAASFQAQEYIEDEEVIFSPRALAFTANEVLISNWGPYDENWSLTGSWISVLDKTSKSLIKKIALPLGPEGIAISGNRVFVACHNFGMENKLVVIDTDSWEILNTIDTPVYPSHFIKNNQSLWLVCQGSWGDTDGALMRVDETNPEQSVSFELGSRAGSSFDFSAEGDEIIFFDGSDVHVFNTSNGEVTSNFISEDEGIYAVSVDPSNGNIYLSLAGDFQSQGKVRIYNQSGQFLRSFDSGIAPQKVYFK